MIYANHKDRILYAVALAHGFTLSSEGRRSVAEKWVGNKYLRATLAGDMKKAARKLGLLAQYEAGLFAFNRQ